MFCNFFELNPSQTLMRSPKPPVIPMFLKA